MPQLVRGVNVSTSVMVSTSGPIVSVPAPVGSLSSTTLNRALALTNTPGMGCLLSNFSHATPLNVRLGSPTSAAARADAVVVPLLKYVPLKLAQPAVVVQTAISVSTGGGGDSPRSAGVPGTLRLE